MILHSIVLLQGQRILCVRVAVLWTKRTTTIRAIFDAFGSHKFSQRCTIFGGEKEKSVET